MPVFTARNPQASTVEGLRSYLTELVGYLRFLLENLDGDNIPSLRGRTFYEEVLRHGGWKGDSAPYTYMLNGENISENSIIALVPSENISAEELVSFQKANITGGKQTNGRIVLKAWGEKPQRDVGVWVLII